MISLSCYILADTYFIARELGANGLAALNLAIPIYSFIFGGGLMLGIGGATKYAIARSQNKVGDANRVYTNTAIIAAFLAAVFFIIGVFFSDVLARAFGADEVVFEMTRIYLRIILLCAPLFILNSVLSSFIRNDGAPVLAMAAMISASFANIAFDYLFIVLLQMGMFGAALATGLAAVVGLVIKLTFFIRKKNNFRLIKCAITRKITLGIFSTGLPTFVTEVSAGAVIVTFNMIILGLQGNIGVAAYGVIANISIVVISIYNGTAGGIQPLISRYYGSGDLKSAKMVLRYALILVTVLSAAFYMIAFFGASQIVAIFNSENNPVLQSLAISGIRIYFIASVFIAFNIIISIYLTSTENPRPAHFISLLRGFVLIIPMAILLSSIGGMTGVWLAFPVTEIITCLLAVGILQYTRKRLH